MSTLIFLFVLLVVIICVGWLGLRSYKDGALDSIHEMRAAFEHYLDAHQVSKEYHKAFEDAEELMDEFEELVKHTI